MHRMRFYLLVEPWAWAVQRLASARTKTIRCGSFDRCPLGSDGSSAAAQRIRPAVPWWCTSRRRPWSRCWDPALRSSACSGVCWRMWRGTKWANGNARQRHSIISYYKIYIIFKNTHLLDNSQFCWITIKQSVERVSFASHSDVIVLGRQLFLVFSDEIQIINNNVPKLHASTTLTGHLEWLHSSWQLQSWRTHSLANGLVHFKWKK